MKMSDFRNKNIHRGIRNNNPGNLIKTKTTWIGKVPHSQNTDSRFEQFTTMEYGVRALMRNVITYMSRGYNTIELLINEWAPTSENDTQGYIDIVSEKTGIAPDKEFTTMDAHTLISLAKAISYKENAPHDKYIKNEVYHNAINILGLDLSKIRFSKFKKKRL